MINRKNYEEYLLLYLDGELSTGDRQAVEAFLAANPDLRQELEILRQTILQPEPGPAFPDKTVLYRSGEGIHLGNYQEYFLLYIDGELNDTDREAVETFVLQQPQLQDEFTVLKSAVLPEETLVFADKASLYRTETRRRAIVVSLRWASLAAAVMIGVVAVMMFNKTDETTPVAVKEKDLPVIEAPEGTTKKEQQYTPSIPAEQMIAATQKEIQTRPASKGNNTTTIAKTENTPVPQIGITGQQQQDQRSLAVIETPPVVSNPVTETVVTGTEQVAGETKATFAANTDEDNNNDVQPAVYTEELETEKEKNVYVGAMQINPDKVRGLFRKASRFLSSKVKNSDEDNDGKLQIANVELNKIK